MRKQILIYDFILSSHFSFSIFFNHWNYQFFFSLVFFLFFFICSILKTSILCSLSFYIKWRNYTIYFYVMFDYCRTSILNKCLINNLDEKKKKSQKKHERDYKLIFEIFAHQSKIELFDSISNRLYQSNYSSK